MKENHGHQSTSSQQPLPQAGDSVNKATDECPRNFSDANSRTHRCPDVGDSPSRLDNDHYSYDNLCIFCIEKAPTFVMKHCGHLCLCSNCRTALYLRAEPMVGIGKSTRSQWQKLFSKRIECPICRTRSSTLHHSRYKGKIFR